MNPNIIYKKINELRSRAKEKNIQRNGEVMDNGVVIYKNYLLEDILDAVAPILTELGICTLFHLTINSDSGMYDARLCIFTDDGKNEYELHMYAPINESENSKLSPLQAAGSNNTAQHKYCWLNLLNLGSDTKVVNKNVV